VICVTARDDRPLSVLHVDDDPDLCALVKSYLERDGSEPSCVVTTETSPTSALERVRTDGTSFDCVVSDYGMGEMNGIEFLEAVRESAPDLPLLLFSSEAASDLAPEVIEAGLTDYLRKGAGADQYTLLVRRLEHGIGGG
jgi:CheY-like chemotaxis protein